MEDTFYDIYFRFLGNVKFKNLRKNLIIDLIDNQGNELKFKIIKIKKIILELKPCDYDGENIKVRFDIDENNQEILILI